MQKATIKDVAKLAKVSPSTVSRVLSGNSSISDDTCKRVKNAVKELHYTPNTTARSLRCEKSKSIGVVFPDISGEFYATCASAILKYARMSDYTVLFTESGHNLKAEKDSIKALLERRIDGIIFIGDNSDIPLIQSIAAQSIPIVTGDRTVGNIPSVTFTNRETVQKMVDSLYKSGCRKFMYVGETPTGQSNLLNRYNGYTDALKKYSDTTSVIFLEESLHGDKLKTARRLFTEKIIASLPDVIITSNDLIAQGIISAAHENGINIPNDMQITGFDDSLSSAYFIPSVTTVSQNIDKLAKRCFSMLMDLINKKSAVSSIIEQNIIARNSAKINI